ncbi:MAG: NAD(P)/FAD-dependent oxidoreductase, partial [Candidatus Omnitrophica bacterium]|nr:NAD(P)/FAD-dependent oxidoreductase [Candidatus Omnitrophota bacterium]
HFGFSGPAALDISRHVARSKQLEDYEIQANFVPQENEESLKKKIALFDARRGKKLLENFLRSEFSLPERFVKTLLKKVGTEARNKISQSLLAYPLPVSGVVGYKKAEVTAGGVDLNEIHHSTMESKRVPGLYFCGEILDVDGRIGGFNFQWAWSSGVLAGRGASQSLVS